MIQECKNAIAKQFSCIFASYLWRYWTDTNIIYNELRSRGYSVDVGVVEKRGTDENGIATMSIYDFLLKENSLEL